VPAIHHVPLVYHVLREPERSVTSCIVFLISLYVFCAYHSAQYGVAGYILPYQHVSTSEARELVDLDIIWGSGCHHRDRAFYFLPL
jgi:hypothetical protein